MKWEGRRQSSNVEDRRGTRPTGGGRGLKVGGVGGGLGIVILIVYVLMGGNPLNMISMDSQVPSQTQQVPYQETAEESQLADFVSVVLADTETVWNDYFRSQNLVYKEPKLVLFTDAVESACGVAGSSTGPFYCPGDEKIYIDLSFYNELKNRFNAPGDTAMAYVIAHEVGHHVQNQLGILDQTNKLRQQMSREEYNKVSVRVELQADYLAGVWAHYANSINILEEGDLEEAINAAGAVGDDTIQKQAQGYVVPDSFTHGTSEQRMRWFMKGFKAGNLDEWNTFEIDESQL